MGTQRHNAGGNIANKQFFSKVPNATEFPIDFRQSVQDYEVGLIKNALANHQFNKKKTAEAFGVTYRQLRSYLKRDDLLENP